jgi:hypothetical protein
MRFGKRLVGIEPQRVEALVARLLLQRLHEPAGHALTAHPVRYPDTLDLANSKLEDA